MISFKLKIMSAVNGASVRDRQQGDTNNPGGQEGGLPHGAVEHRHETGLDRHSCHCKQQSLK